MPGDRGRRLWRFPNEVVLKEKDVFLQELTGVCTEPVLFEHRTEFWKGTPNVVMQNAIGIATLHGDCISVGPLLQYCTELCTDLPWEDLWEGHESVVV